MKKVFFILSMALRLTACEQAQETGNETAREITGSNMIKQGKQVQQQLHNIDQQQQERYKQLDEQ
ncbi:MAG: hypothetical protein R8K54_01875, partial [Mariprofundaceae bacterium]